MTKVIKEKKAHGISLYYRFLAMSSNSGFGDINDWVQALVDEIEKLRKQNKILQEDLIKLQTPFTEGNIKDILNATSDFDEKIDSNP